MAGGTRSSGIAIVGSGVAGLHLALLLQKQGIPVTLYSDQTAAQLASGRARSWRGTGCSRGAPVANPGRPHRTTITGGTQK
jgi:glycine/D-amino acid oxidase-like deaminating enzyme